MSTDDDIQLNFFPEKDFSNLVSSSTLLANILSHTFLFIIIFIIFVIIVLTWIWKIIELDVNRGSFWQIGHQLFLRAQIRDLLVEAWIIIWIDHGDHGDHDDHDDHDVHDDDHEVHADDHDVHDDDHEVHDDVHDVHDDDHKTDLAVRPKEESHCPGPWKKWFSNQRQWSIMTLYWMKKSKNHVKYCFIADMELLETLRKRTSVAQSWLIAQRAESNFDSFAQFCDKYNQGFCPPPKKKNIW